MATTNNKEMIRLEKKYRNLLNDQNSDVSAGASSLLILLERETKQISHRRTGGRVTAKIIIFSAYIYSVHTAVGVEF